MNHNSWVLPLTIIERPMDFMGKSLGDWKVFEVVTVCGNRVGPRLLKGQQPPIIRDWGPFNDRDNAANLKAVLEQHIEAEWPRKKRRKGK